MQVTWVTCSSYHFSEGWERVTWGEGAGYMGPSSYQPSEGWERLIGGVGAGDMGSTSYQLSDAGGPLGSEQPQAPAVIKTLIYNTFLDATEHCRISQCKKHREKL